MSVRTWTVDELCTAIGEVLEVAFPDQLWIRGEIQSYRTTAAGHTYFDLVDGGDLKIGVTLFRGKRRGVEAVLRKVGGLTLADGVEVRIRGRVEWYARQGRVQLIMDGIDPRHTLGRLAMERERVIRTLTAEGLLGRNASLALPELPLRVGLVTSAHSAAEADVLHVLEGSGLAFRVLAADARVQGAEAEASLVAALAQLDRMDLDVVLLVRGGGSRGDLSAFDIESVARAVATMSVPVLTGVGHEIDRSVADEAAHLAFTTPTAAAHHLVERCRGWVQRLDETWSGIGRRADAHLSNQNRALGARAHRLRLGTSGTLAQGLDRLATADARLAASGPRALQRAGRRLDTAAGQLAGAGRVHLRNASGRLDRAATGIDVGARRHLAGAERDLAAAEGLVRSLNPERTLARGFSVTLDAEGRLVRDPGQISPGDRLTTRLATGTLTSTVDQAETKGTTS